ncbi:MlotiK1 channel [Salinivirga cyanobacteriivorans]|uniref:MlotiK1 channel n=1 Tax=Salinivirga cyanobacteriivorans TaxID=1307839 RepID=A0A0S2I3E9_9BACT|nr:ion transporter [Salinivirga cyanobacteriivorans]ALO16865.1 MlotiK1 channel [Salinivirga cyanobacteriivorans]
MQHKKHDDALRKTTYKVIFHTDTPAGKLFDVTLLIIILVSVLVVMLDSVKEIRDDYIDLLYAAEWTITIIFTLEYILRILVHPHPQRYIFSFYGIIDLLAALPTYVALFLAGTHYLAVIRALRLFRVFRILKLSKFTDAGSAIAIALKNSKSRISVFLYSIFIIVIVIGSLMYLIEGPDHGFTSIPRSIYWAIVTLTTVGYGDISPGTDLGQFIASLIMILGYSIIAVPTGIVSAEMARMNKTNRKRCKVCGCEDHESDALFCKNCGESLSSD